jgi:UDP-N-acetylglucosamine acyltransferase
MIHPTAVVSDEAKVGNNVQVGAYSVIGPQVEIGDNSIIHPHVVLDGNLKIGKDNTFFQFCSIGAPPQDLSYKGEDTKVIIGDNNVFREYVSIHRGTTKENLVTTLGSNILLMAHVHIGHDAVIGDNSIIVNSVNLAGHVKIGERCTIGGGTNISQFVTIGRGAYIGGASGVDRDIPPFCTAFGNRARLKGINIIGLRRHGIEKHLISEVVDFYRSMEVSALSPRAFVQHEELMDEFSANPIATEISGHIEKSEIGIAPFM